MIRALCLLLLLAGCSAQPIGGAAAGSSGRPVTSEAGFSAFCATHRGQGVCP